MGVIYVLSVVTQVTKTHAATIVLANVWLIPAVRDYVREQLRDANFCLVAPAVGTTK